MGSKRRLERPGAVGLRKPRGRRSRLTRAKIVEATVALTKAQGFERTSMGQIARQAGIATSTLYHHFADKRALLSVLMDEWSERVVAERRADLELQRFIDSEPRAFLTAFLRKVYERLQDRNWIYVELLILSHRDEELRGRFRAIRDAGADRLAMMIELGQRQGVLRKDPDPMRAAVLLANSLEMVAIHLHMLRRPREETEGLLEELTGMICRYLVDDA